MPEAKNRQINLSQMYFLKDSFPLLNYTVMAKFELLPGQFIILKSLIAPRRRMFGMYLFLFLTAG